MEAPAVKDLPHLSAQKRKHHDSDEANIEIDSNKIANNGHVFGNTVPNTSERKNLTKSSNCIELKGQIGLTASSDKPTTNDDEEYFHSYSDVRCHLTMIEDHTRTFAYKCSILRSYKSLHRRRVLDVGAGSGILSVFCAQAGAGRVVALEASETMAELAKEVAQCNGYGKVIKVHNMYAENYAEENTVVNGSQNGSQLFDAIVSEWMGYTLLSEWMLESVLITRDKLLKPGGLMFPQTADLYLAPAMEDDLMADQIHRWNSCAEQYKINLDPLAEAERRSILGKMVIRPVNPHCIVSLSAKLISWDLRTLALSVVQNPITADFLFNCFGQAEVTSFVLWFQTGFPGDVNLTSSPYSSTGTHWHQTLLYLPLPILVDQGSLIWGNIILRKSQISPRCLEIELKYASKGPGEKDGDDDKIPLTTVTFGETLSD